MSQKVLECSRWAKPSLNLAERLCVLFPSFVVVAQIIMDLFRELSEVLLNAPTLMHPFPGSPIQHPHVLSYFVILPAEHVVMHLLILGYLGSERAGFISSSRKRSIASLLHFLRIKAAKK
ncbi:hypothetical protein B0H10DRAFT_1952202 [Mycena sp. CBHHK59/15]|nr:hypothetical protein B0H10DRAFT_1952202 [Mycena sp. CBHHK59/15]